MPRLPWHMRAHSHPFHELVVVIKGCQRVKMDGVVREGGVGDVLLYPAGMAHEEWADEQGVFESFFMAFEADLPRAIPLPLHDHGGRIRMLVEWLREDMRLMGGDGASAEVLRGLVSAIVAQLARMPSTAEPELVERVRRHIREHVAEPLTLDGLAHVAGLSKFYFLRRYAGLAGRAPMADVRLIRVERARELVLSTSLPLKEIAVRAGLGDVYHMTRLFRHHLDRTPGQLRRMVR
ncbi:MAG: hypothetical protein A2498_03455 [Lentisphaerae bacterium RIFOXYC12_FULL_60_16]|nr:MAG: hypothetical protein A2498_03455 [Lentisphaerae bacterium RIFOXYC12_FULL_60_16]OGV86332.1 MAG: hypothetical protein A2340_01295 [Lentisphaerae bacterium RIFOXYB12_FULL_60_10]